MDHELHKPLLGDTIEDDNVVETAELERSSSSNGNGDDDDVRAVWFLCSLKVMGSDDDDDDDDDDANDLEKNLTYDGDSSDDIDINDVTALSRKWYWNCLISSVLPLLLYFQFYVTYHYNRADDSNDFESMIFMTNDWPSIQWSIFLFVVTSVLYRQSMVYQSDVDSSDKNVYWELILHLIPDIIIDIVLILILFHYYIAAVLVLQISTIFLAVNSILNSCNCSIRFGATSLQIN